MSATPAPSSFADFHSTISGLSAPAKAYGALQLIYISSVLTEQDHSHPSKTALRALGELIGGLVGVWVVNGLYQGGYQKLAWATAIIAPVLSLVINLLVMIDEHRGETAAHHAGEASGAPKI